MRTQYASGRLVLPAPIVTTEASGNINGGGNTYYFWLKARNRVGYNSPSQVQSLTIADNSKVILSASSFSTQPWEDWRHLLVFVSTTDDFNTSRVIYRQELYEPDQVTSILLNDVEFNEDFILNSTGLVNSTEDFPVEAPEGYRVLVTSINKVYEYYSQSSLVVDNINIFAGSGTDDRWVYVLSNSLTEFTTTCNKELIEVTQQEFIPAPLESFLTTPVPLKYYIHNDGTTPISVGQLFLNEYSSNTTILPAFYVRLLGYLNLDTYDLDTSGITNVNLDIPYPQEDIRLSKNLPSGSAFVVSITPDVITSSAILKGTYVTLYPLLAPYTLIEEVKYWDEPVDTIATLKALNPIQIKDGQARIVKSVNSLYKYNSSSTLDDNGTTIIAPNGNPTTGRWIAEQASLLPGSVTVDTLSDDVLDLFSGDLSVITINIPTPTTYTIDLDSTEFDYFIINAPLTDEFNTQTTLNVTATLSNNQAKAIMLELRQKTSLVNMDASFLWPGGTAPLLSGNAKTDLLVVLINKDGEGVVKKRVFVVQQDIG